jgi:hypothetical protein
LDLLNGNIKDSSVPTQTRSKMSQTMLQFSVETNTFTSKLFWTDHTRTLNNLLFFPRCFFTF